MKYENNYVYFFDKRNSIQLKSKNQIQKPLRLPEELWVLIRDEMRNLEDVGEKTTYNDYVLYTLMSALNINRNNDGVLKIGNKMSIDYYINKIKTKEQFISPAAKTIEKN